jgi:hypothetical protein
VKMALPHRRQFVVGPRPMPVREEWAVADLTGAWLSHCPDLAVERALDADGAEWLLLGLAAQSSAAAPDPAEATAQARTMAVSQRSQDWAGRWALLGDGRVQPDSAALLGIFYARDAAGQTWASSSAALLARALGGEPAADPRELRYDTGISWYAPPRSRFERIRRLLPSQTLDFRTGEVRPRELMPPLDPGRSLEAALGEVTERLATPLQRLARRHGPLWLGLTAGYDSRLMLALARHADIDVRPFTRVAARMTDADRVLPPLLARRAGFGHQLVRGGGGRSREQLVAEHSGGHVSSGDAEPLLEGARDRLRGVSVGGHGFALASGFGGLRSLPPMFGDPRTTAERICELFGEPPGSSAADGLAEWLEWADATPQEHLDWRDRFFLEQRQAGWLSAKEQVYDLLPLRRFFGLNAATTHALLLSIPESERLGSRVQRELIRRLAPDLDELPYNPPAEALSRFRVALTRTRDDPGFVPRKAAGRVRRLLKRTEAPGAKRR